MFITLQLIANITVVVSNFIGLVLITKKERSGFLVFFIAEVSLAYLGAISLNYGLIALAIVYIIMNIYGYIEWGKE